MNALVRKLVMTMVVAGVLVGALAPVANAARFTNDAEDSDGNKCSSSFLGFPTWFKGLPRKPGTCDIAVSTKTTTDSDGNKVESVSQDDLNTFIFRIVLNVIEIVMRIIGFAAVGFVIYGGFKYLTSAGSADRIASGKKVIQNALIGLLISIFSIAIVNLIAGNLA